jgi:hypothetical protein
MPVADIKARRARHERAEAKMDATIRASQELMVSIQKQIMAAVSAIPHTQDHYEGYSSKNQEARQKLKTLMAEVETPGWPRGGENTPTCE